MIDKAFETIPDGTELNLHSDRGTEFGDPDSLENGIEGIVRTSIYYCDAMRSCQKPGVENVHTMLRMVLPKKNIFRVPYTMGCQPHCEPYQFHSEEKP